MNTIKRKIKNVWHKLNACGYAMLGKPCVSKKCAHSKLAEKILKAKKGEIEKQVIIFDVETGELKAKNHSDCEMDYSEGAGSYKIDTNKEMIADVFAEEGFL